MDGLDDPERLKALRATGLMDSPAEPAFDRLTSLAARVVGAPISLVSLVDVERQFFKSAYGFATEPWATARGERGRGECCSADGGADGEDGLLHDEHLRTKGSRRCSRLVEMIITAHRCSPVFHSVAERLQNRPAGEPTLPRLAPSVRDPLNRCL